MKSYNVYKNIRKSAMIFGLALPLFAFMMASIILSLMILIFSFGAVLLLVLIIFNSCLYVGLTRFQANPNFLSTAKVYPGSISNKKTNVMDYEED